MARCWTCGSDLAGGGKYFFPCPACSGVEELEEIQQTLDEGFSQTIAVMEAGFRELSMQLANIASILEWGFEKLQWELGEMTEALKSIDKTLRTPSLTQANEWRQIAEELRRRRQLRESESFLLKSLEANPLDYRTYIGLGKTYLRLGDGDKARLYWEKSLPHAPKEEAPLATLGKDRVRRLAYSLKRDTGQSWVSALRRRRSKPDEPEEIKEIFDYKSYSYRLIGRLHFCEGNIGKATATLKKAIDLSPNYCFAQYDYAQYSALSGDKEACLSSLWILMKESTILELAEREKNLEKFKKEIQILLQSTICMREMQQAVKKANEAFDRGSARYFHDPNFLLRVLNPFNRFWDELFSLNKAMDEDYELAQQTAYQASPDEIFETDRSLTDYAERVRSCASQTTELAHKTVDLVKKKYH